MCIGPDEEELIPIPEKGDCLICKKTVEGLGMRCCHTRILGEDEEFKRNVFCLDCYNKGKFETRCCVCGMYFQCAPTHLGDPNFMCIGCQWSKAGQKVAAEQASAKVQRTAT